jgi:transposase
MEARSQIITTITRCTQDYWARSVAQSIARITSVQRRRRWPTAEKIRLVEETMQPGMSMSYVARRAGVAPSLLFNWRRRMLEGGLQAVQADEDVVATSQVRELERRVRELERLLGRKTMEVEILKEALDVARVKKPSLQLPSWNGRKDGSHEGRSRHTRGRPLEPDRAGERGRQAAPALSQGRRAIYIPEPRKRKMIYSAAGSNTYVRRPSRS